MITPSTINGTRTNQFVAPTDFMMLISSLRENMVARMVLEMMNSDTRLSRRIIQKPPVVIMWSSFVSFAAMSE